MALAGGLATAVSQMQPVLETFGSLSPWLAGAVLVVVLAAVVIWRTKKPVVA